MNKSTAVTPYLCLFSAMVLWASSFVALKLAFQNFHPMVVLFSRMFIGSLCFLCLPALYRSFRIHRADIKSILLMVFFEPCLYFLFEARAIELTTASQAGIITSFMPLMVSVAAFLILKERLTQRTLAGMVLSVFGACWLSFSGQISADSPNPPLGNLCEMMAMACGAGYTILLKQLTEKGYSPLFLTAMQAFMGSIFYFPFLLLPSTPFPATVEPVSLAAVIYLGSAVTFGAYGCYNFGVSKIPAGQAASFINLIPVFSLAMGLVILKETMTVQQYLASAMVFTGIFMSQHRDKQIVETGIPVK
ncbi:MAG: DMT family transporter [Pseudomonadota bacterium]